MKKYDPFADVTLGKSDGLPSNEGDTQNNDRFGAGPPKSTLWSSEVDKAIGFEAQPSNQSSKQHNLSFKATSPILILVLGIFTLAVTLFIWISPNSDSQKDSRQALESSSESRSKDKDQVENTDEKSVVLRGTYRCNEKRYGEIRARVVEELRKQGKSEKEIQQIPEEELVPGRKLLGEDSCRRIDLEGIGTQEIRPSVGDLPVQMSSAHDSKDTRTRGDNAKSTQDSRSEMAARPAIDKSFEVSASEKEKRVLEEKLKAQELARLAAEKRQRELELALEREKRNAAEESLKRAQIEVQEREMALNRSREAKEKLEADNVAREQALAKERQRNSELERELKDQNRSGVIPNQRPKQNERGEVVCLSTPSPVLPAGMKIQNGRIRATAYVRQGIGVVDVKINESNMPRDFEDLVIQTMKRYNCYVRNGNEGETWRDFLFKP